MSEMEFRRGAVLRRVQEGEMGLREAAELLGVSYRHAKRLAKRYRERGHPGLVHGNTARRSNRALPSAYRDEVLALVRAHYGGKSERGAGQRFGPTLVAEHLWSDHGVLVPVTTLTRWMRAAELWGRVRKSKRRHARRARKAHFGELVQLDGSFHDWFEGRGPRSCVMTMVDDATGRTLVRFGAEETTWAAADILQRWITAYGVPRALYTDWKNVYLRTPTSNELARGEVPVTQFGRMCRKLGIQVIGASSPQAKGRVERGHGTHQDRLIKKLRLKGIADDEAANAYVEGEYEAEHNARFAVAPASGLDYHTPRDRRAKQRRSDDDVFCLETTRVVGNDFVVQYGGRGLQLDRRARGRVPVKSRVVVRETQAGLVRVVHVGRDGVEHRLAWTAAAPRSVRQRASATVARSVEDAAARGAPVRPAADHPWREQHQRWIQQAMQRKAARAQAREARRAPPAA